MNKQIHPAALIAAIVVVVALLVVYGFKASQPAPYTPSPGAAGTPGVTAGRPGAPGGDASHPAGYYPVAPAGSTPGKPLSGGGAGH